jgi:hypothetical protein
MIGYGILIVFGAAIWGMAGYVTGNILMSWGNGFINNGVASQDAFDSAFIIVQIIIASPFFGLLLWGYDHIMNSLSDTSGDT